MYGGFTYTEFVGSLTDCGFGFDDILAGPDGTLFNIGFHKNPCIVCFLQCMQGVVLI